MCIFSREVDRVSGTNIFARASKQGKQYLVYSMMLQSRYELAMILPIPVPSNSAEKAVRFISLEKYPEFFSDLYSGFQERSRTLKSAPKTAKTDTLEVVQVGGFDASFVPTLRDFVRLDERFRLPNDVWAQLPLYANYGFVVFMLRKGSAKIHPMAFEFPRANPQQLFFPTVHVHDGKVHKSATFDHVLFCQSSGEAGVHEWEESPQPAGLFAKIDRSAGILDAGGHVYRLAIRGRHSNTDILV